MNDSVAPLPPPATEFSWMAMSPARAPSSLSLSSSVSTVKTLKGLIGGNWSMLIVPASVNSTSALGTGLVEYGLLMYRPKLLTIKSLTAF